MKGHTCDLNRSLLKAMTSQPALVLALYAIYSHQDIDYQQDYKPGQDFTMFLLYLSKYIAIYLEMHPSVEIDWLGKV